MPQICCCGIYVLPGATAAPKPEGEGAPETAGPGAVAARERRGEERRGDKGTKRATYTWHRLSELANSSFSARQRPKPPSSKPERHRAERTSNATQRHRVRGKAAPRVPAHPRPSYISNSMEGAVVNRVECGCVPCQLAVDTSTSTPTDSPTRAPLCIILATCVC